MNDLTTKQGNKNNNPTGKGGFNEHPENRNDGGRLPNPLKAFQREKFEKMSDKEKEEFLNKIDEYKRWAMAEGNPPQPITGESGGDIVLQILNYGAKNNPNSPPIQSKEIPVEPTDKPSEV